MKLVKVLAFIVVATSCLSGCATTLLVKSLTGSATVNQVEPEVNQQLLHAIQSLRALQPPKQTSYVFGYQRNQAALGKDEQQQLTRLLLTSNRRINIEIAPAKARTLWKQLALTHKRVEAIQLLAQRINKPLTIVFQPSLADDTIKIVVRA